MKLDYLRSRNQFFYLREFDPAATPIVTRKGKKHIMLGSNNYLGLVNHPKVMEATAKAIEQYGTSVDGSGVFADTISLMRNRAAFVRIRRGVILSTTACVFAGFLFDVFVGH
jgi:7-keto-8-aminopelargonate synthetase-like enzyme